MSVIFVCIGMMDWGSAKAISNISYQEISKLRQSRIPSILLGIRTRSSWDKNTGVLFLKVVLL